MTTIGGPESGASVNGADIDATPDDPTSGAFNLWVFAMKASPIRIAFNAMALAFTTTGRVNAGGCLRGAVVGGDAGHCVGHHAVVGAVGRWVVGRRLAQQHAQRQAQQAAERPVAHAQ